MSEYQLIDHDADLRIQVFGRHPEDLFRNAAFAISELVSDSPAEGPRGDREEYRIAVTGIDRPDLLMNWLREILYLWHVKALIVKSVRILTIDECNMDSVVGCVRFDPRIHAAGTEIKAVTYHMLEVVQEASGWSAKIILDT